MCKTKSIVSLILVVVMLATVALAAVSCKPNPGPETETEYKNYTYKTYTTSLGTNWNPHTWETNADSAIMGYIETPFVDMTVKNSATGEYQWIFLAATDIKDVTAANQADLEKYGAAEKDATEGYVYEIKLRPEMCWEDGTPINADTYIYSMKAMLDPAMRNYRANNYYSGESAIAGAYAYYNSEAPIYAPVVPAYGEGETPDYSLDLSKYKIYIDLNTTGMTFAGYSFKEIKDDYGYIYDEFAEDGTQTAFGATYYAELAKEQNAFGYIEVTEANKDKVLYVMNQYTGAFGLSIYNEDGSVNDEFYREFLFYFTETYGEKVEFDTVGVYKVDDYTIRYVCATAYDYYYFLTSCTSNWLVYESLYESQKDDSGELTTTKYGTSKETTMSYGPYKMESLQDEKQMVFVQNEKYFEYTADENGHLTSTSEKAGFQVDGEYVEQYMTQKIVIDVLTDDAAKLEFLSGKLDDWTPAADEVVNYTTSDQLYQVDETYTMRLFFNTNLDALKAMDTKGNKNSVVMSNYTFRQAMSLAIDRSEFVTATAGYKAAYSLINSLYFYDVYENPASIYRNTEEAMQAVCNIYGVKYGPDTPYATLEEAYKSINGLNLTEAKALMKQACDELVEAGLYTAGEDIVIEMGWKAGTNDSTDLQQVALLNKYLNAAAEGSGFGTIELKPIDNLSNRYADVAAGAYAIGWGAWGGAAFYPFTMFRVYCDPSYTSLHEAGCWDPATETLTLTIDGEEVTMTWQEWSVSMTGTGKYADASNETKLQVLAAIEENFIKLYYCIPICTTTACSMLSYKLSYYTENYSIMYGFGGLRLIRYNYDDAEWDAYVASQNNQLDY